MSNDRPSRNCPEVPVKQPPWLIVILLLGLLGVTWWQGTRESRETTPTGVASHHEADQEPIEETASPHDFKEGSEQDFGRNEPVLPEVAPEIARESTRNRPPQSKPKQSGNPAVTGGSSAPDALTQRDFTRPTSDLLRIDNQTIRDQDGNVVFQGTIDLQPTLDRIRRGERNSHRNDGATFQNREGRLPRKPPGYYKEFVHTTKGLGGPGPQRVIIGGQGEVWYSPDHYKSFRKIK